MRIRTLLLITVIGICDHWSIDPPELHFEPLGSMVSVYGPSRLCFKPLRLMSFDLNADLDQNIMQIRIRSPSFILFVLVVMHLWTFYTVASSDFATTVPVVIIDT